MGTPSISYLVPGFPNFGSLSSSLMILRDLNFWIIRGIYHSCLTIMTRSNPFVYQISVQLSDALNKSTIITQLLQIRTKFLLAAITLAFILTDVYCLQNKCIWRKYLRIYEKLFWNVKNHEFFKVTTLEVM